MVFIFCYTGRRASLLKMCVHLLFTGLVGLLLKMCVHLLFTGSRASY